MLYVPEGHTVQDTEPAVSAYEPAAHTVQVADLGDAVYLPAVQNKHRLEELWAAADVLASLKYVPAEQEVQSLTSS